jgi:hypothetical protein
MSKSQWDIILYLLIVDAQSLVLRVLVLQAFSQPLGRFSTLRFCRGAHVILISVLCKSTPGNIGDLGCQWCQQRDGLSKKDYWHLLYMYMGH